MGLNGSKNSGKIDTNSGAIYFGMCNRLWAHSHLQIVITRQFWLWVLGDQFKTQEVNYFKSLL